MKGRAPASQKKEKAEVGETAASFKWKQTEGKLAFSERGRARREREREREKKRERERERGCGGDR
jgi:hypothetical protein